MEDIDFANRMISAMPIKTKGIQRNVHIPLHPQLKVQLDLVAGTNTNKGYIMPKMVERYEINHDGILDDFHRLLDLESVGLKEIHTAKRGLARRVYSFHSLRHSFASFAASNAGVPITTLAAILGDNVRTLEKYYIKTSDESKTKVIMSLPTMNSGTGKAVNVKLASNIEQALKVIKKALESDSTGNVKQAMINILQLPVKI